MFIFKVILYNNLTYCCNISEIIKISPALISKSNSTLKIFASQSNLCH